MIIRFAKAMINWVRHGMLMANNQEIKLRVIACELCSQRSGKFCRECGCFLPFKRIIATEKCPLNLW